MSLTAPRGLICPLFIPFGGDERAISRLALRVLPHVDGLALDPGFFPLGPIPSPDEMARDLSLVLAVVGGKPLFVKLIANSGKEAARCLALYEELMSGMDADPQVFYLDAPLYYRGNRGLPGHYERLLEKTKRGIVLVNDPGLIKVRKGIAGRKNIRTSVLKKLTRIEGVVGLVHRSTVTRGLNYARAARHRPGFRLFEGHEGQFISSPSSAGLFARTANLLPEQWAALVDGVLESRAPARTAAMRLFALGERLGELARLVEKAPHKAVSAGLAMLGHLSAPDHPVEPALQKELARLLEAQPAHQA